MQDANKKTDAAPKKFEKCPNTSKSVGYLP